MTKPLTLHAHEIRRLQRAGGVTLWRPVKPQPIDDDDLWPNNDSHLTWYELLQDTDYYVRCGHCPHGAPGQARWIRERWVFGHAPNDDLGQGIAVFLDVGGNWQASRNHPHLAPERINWCRQWTPRSPVTMPRWASRYTVTVQDVTCKRITDLDDEEAIAAGIVWSPGQRSDPKIDFVVTWDEHFGKKYPYGLYPWAWGVSVTLTAQED